MADHLLHLDAIEEGSAIWRFTCEHVAGGRWRCTLQDGTPDPNMTDECWLLTWWDNCGSELVDINIPIASLPIPVRPGVDWDYDNGGSITFDNGATP